SLDPSNGSNYSFPTQTNAVITVRIPDTALEMVDVPGGTVTYEPGYFDPPGSGIFMVGRPVTLSPFKIAAIETPWNLWNEVYQWATITGKDGNLYSFSDIAAYQGHEAAYKGENGTGTGTGSASWTLEERRSRPVTNITWAEAIVWCNAYSEKSGFDPVYLDEPGGAILRDSASAACDNAYMDRTRNGYRLPTEAEWEYAARGGKHPDFNWAYYYSGTGSTTFNDVAWNATNSKNLGSTNRDYGVHPGGMKQTNSLGLYDMSGNVTEWCFDWFEEPVSVSGPVTDPQGPASGTGRAMRGGAWDDQSNSLMVSARFCFKPEYTKSDFVGFRVVRGMGS
ncbi:MAG: formylglycine-generating enzyme family protein, partial [Treponema sp.]|nr:formylglycine-generating enzyme family protein [Treponema sp.]